MEDFTLLQNAPQKTRATRLSENCKEIDFGMKAIGYEVFDLNITNDNPRVEKITSYKNAAYIITFYITSEITMGMKIFRTAGGLVGSTQHFSSIGIADARTIISTLL